MKRFFSFVLAVLLLASLCACREGGHSDPVKRIYLSELVGVWSNADETVFYRFTPTGVWYRYNDDGEVEAKGAVSYDGTALSLLNEEETVQTVLAVESVKSLRGDADGKFHRTDAPHSLATGTVYSAYYAVWYENADLEGRTLTVSEPDQWKLASEDGKTEVSGTFCAFAGEEDQLYLFRANDTFFANISIRDDQLLMNLFSSGQTVDLTFDLEENSTIRHSYFKEKGIKCNYTLGSGLRLLRNGGAVYNDARDYKRMSVSCSMEAVDMTVEEGVRTVDVVVQYVFRRSDLPAMTGRLYNSVRFSQYDYYTGELFLMEDLTGDDLFTCEWNTEHDGVPYRIGCEFSSSWEYPAGDEIIVRWSGTYHLTMPEEYDGLVLCCRPVLNSYAAQLAPTNLPEETTFALDDLGEDAEKSLLCRLDWKSGGSLL